MSSAVTALAERRHALRSFSASAASRARATIKSDHAIFAAMMAAWRKSISWSMRYLLLASTVNPKHLIDTLTRSSLGLSVSG